MDYGPDDDSTCCVRKGKDVERLGLSYFVQIVAKFRQVMVEEAVLQKKPGSGQTDDGPDSVYLLSIDPAGRVQIARNLRLGSFSDVASNDMKAP